MSDKITQQVEQLGVFPIVVIDDPDQVVPLGHALIEGGLPCVEFTFRTQAAAASIERFSANFPEVLLGAGTVLTREQARQALDAGARFVVTPGMNPLVVDYCLEIGLTIFPGVCTPTDVENALARGLSVLKFFPAEAIGGVSYLRALGGPFRQVRFIPTGGIHSSNLALYLSLSNVIACGGSWMVKQDLIRAGNFPEIVRLVRETVSIVRNVRGQEEKP